MLHVTVGMIKLFLSATLVASNHLSRDCGRSCMMSAAAVGSLLDSFVLRLSYE